jgi:hypothetical protein
MHQFHPNHNDEHVCNRFTHLLTKKIIEGDAARARRNKSRTAFSDSPTHLLKSYTL